MRIICGWCAAATPEGTCSACGRDPVLPWVQRGEFPPTEAQARVTTARRRLSEARRQLGPRATLDAIAEFVGVSPRTVRRWQEMSGNGRPAALPAPSDRMRI